MSATDLDASIPMPSRRRFIATALALAAGGLLPMSLRAADNGAPGAPLTAALTDPAAAARLGGAYLDDHPAETDIDTITALLTKALEARPDGVPSGPAALRAAFTALVENEYIATPLVQVDGWLLAPSEARLYALAALAVNPRHSSGGRHLRRG